MSSQLPSLMEFVILFQDQHMICTVDTPKIESTIETITNSIKNWHVDKKNEIIMINGITGPCYAVTPLIMGFYLRPAHKETTASFQKKLLEIAERQTNAAEKIAGECGHGEDWKQ